MASYPVLESLGLPQPPDLDKKDKERGIEKSNVTQELERRELKHALTAAQESAVVQILLECCLRQPSEMKESSLLTNLREVQCLICSFLHQMFIADPNLAKLVHFQGYPSELLPVTVAGIPSMHICLDFIPELLSQPQMEKQMFAVELASHLCLQYALPKALNIARLVINIMFTLSSALATEDRVEYLVRTVPSLVRICQAFPPLCEDATGLLTQVGRICVASLGSTSNVLQTAFPNEEEMDVGPDVLANGDSVRKVSTYVKGTTSACYLKLHQIVRTTFSEIVQKAIVMKNMY